MKQYDIDEQRELSEHIQELRNRVILVLVVFVIALMGSLFFAKPIIEYLQHIEIAEHFNLHAFKVIDPIRIYLSVSIVIAFIIVSPLIMYQTWAFVSPGLHEKEQKATLSYIPFAILLLLLGILFGFYVVVPLVIRFTTLLSADMGIETTIGINEYFSFLFQMTIPFGLIFQFPIVLLFLTRLGIVTPMILRKYRKYAYFILFVVASFIAPPDIMTHVLVTLPLIVLYEISILIARIGYKKRLKAEEQALLDELDK